MSDAMRNYGASPATTVEDRNQARLSMRSCLGSTKHDVNAIWDSVFVVSLLAFAYCTNAAAGDLLDLRRSVEDSSRGLVRASEAVCCTCERVKLVSLLHEVI